MAGRFRAGLLVALLLAAGTLAAGLFTPLGSRKANFEKFERFEFAQLPLLGFCPRLGEALDALIVRQPNGNYLFTASMIEEGDPAVDECADIEIEGEDCAVIRELPPRELAAAELTRIRRAFRAIKFDTLQIGEVCVDPCRLVLTRWDGVESVDTVHGCGPDAFEVTNGQNINDFFDLLHELARP